MSQYPEHDKLSQISDQSQSCGEFVEWLHSEGLHLMRWREDLTDQRLTDPKCLNWHLPMPRGCSEIPEGTDGHALPMSERTRHCAHWLDVAREQANPLRQQGTCCRCDRGRFYEVTGVKSWVEDTRTLPVLLADFFGIDQNEIEAEKRAMLKACQEAAAAS